MNRALKSFTPEIYEWLDIFHACSDKRVLLNSIVKTQVGIKWFKSELITMKVQTSTMLKVWMAYDCEKWTKVTSS